MTNPQQQRLLRIAHSGVFARFGPKELYDLREDLLTFNPESLKAPEFFSLLELQFYVSLLTNHDVEAKGVLDKLVDQFGSENSQRVKLLQSMYLEAIGDDERASGILSKDADELELSRRLTTFSRKETKKSEGSSKYIDTLIFYLDLNPSDIKTWAELANEYINCGNYDKAIYCFKEVLLYEPKAYNIFYQVGLCHYYRFLQQEEASKDKKEKILECIQHLTGARNNFLRSIELCSTYQKAWDGLKLILESNFNTGAASKFASTKEVKVYLEEINKLKKIKA